MKPPYRLPVYLACTLASLIVNYVLGKDMAWDTLNYHLYSGFSALNDRFSKDYFAAGVPSYFNPYIYAPFYFLVKAGLSALTISSILAAVHSALLWMIYELALLICPSKNLQTRMLLGACAVILGFMNPLVIQETGSCFADVTTAELVLAGWLLLVSDFDRGRLRCMVGAGLLMGAASALKMSNAIPSFAAFVLVFGLPSRLIERFRNAAAFGISLGVGFALVAAPWSFRLWRRFGNPLFPMLNNVFRSPEYTTAAQGHARFIPHNLLEALGRPVAMINPARMIHEELRAPDLRYALFEILAIAILTRWIWRRARGGKELPQNPSAPPNRAIYVLALAFGASWALWLSGSGNSRYFIPMACVAGVVAMGLFFELFADRPKIRNYALVAIFAAQAIQLFIGAEFRWRPVTWQGPYFAVDVPQRLQKEPNLYMTIGAQSNSFLAPFLAKDSGLINFSGGYALSDEGAPGDSVKALIRHYSPHIRMLIGGAKLYDDNERRAPQRTLVDDKLERFGLRTDMTDCMTISVHNLPPDLEITYTSSVPAEPQSPDTTFLVSCQVIPGTADQTALAADRRAAALVLDRLEDACPALFSPRRPLTEHDGERWLRVYTNTDLNAWVSHGWVKFWNPVSGDKMVFVGRASEWQKKPLPLDCGMRDGIAYARVVDSERAP